MDARWHETFVDFGDDPLMPFPISPLTRIQSDKTDELRGLVSRNAPKLPGVYGMLDATGRLIYVGKSKSLRNRLLSYFMPNNTDEKAGRIIQSAETIVWEKQPSDFGALLREQMLIRRWQPRLNVVGMPKRQQQAFICIGHAPAEHFYLCKHFDPEAKCSHGPFSGMGNLHRAVETLNRLYLLRDCSQKTPMMYTDQMQLFDLELRAGCVRQEIGTCLAPCLSTCSRQRYGEQVEKAIHFLNGFSVEVLGLVEQQMNKAAASQHFEHAARMRDDFKILKWLSNRLASFKRAREQYSFIYSVKGCDGRDIWYLIRKGGIEHAIAMPKNASHWRSARTALSRWHQSNESVGAGFLRCEETIGLVATWFQKNRDELRETKSLAEIPARWSEMQISMNQQQLTVG
ncbi:MAG: GIY-YIG nuclease family protein [Planctomycetota bacterium]|nr:GIY-YIG nuclease family protein [Planctomycetota bacterium]